METIELLSPTPTKFDVFFGAMSGGFMFSIQSHFGPSRVSVCSSANNLSKGDQTESEVP